MTYGRTISRTSSVSICSECWAETTIFVAQTGFQVEKDLDEAAGALQPDTCAAVLVWENRWAAPIATALRRSGAQLVASGRIPVQAILAQLEAAESAS